MNVPSPTEILVWIRSVWPKIKSLKIAPYIALVILAGLVVALQRSLGLPKEDAIVGVFVVGLLAATFLILNNLRLDPAARRWVGRGMAALLVLASFAVVSVLLLKWVQGGTPPPPTPYPSQQISVQVEFGANVLPRPNLPVSAEDYQRTTYDMKIWLEWIYRAAGPERFVIPTEVRNHLPPEFRDIEVPLPERLRHQLLVLRSQPFREDHDEFSVSVEFGNNAQIKLLNGVAFLVSKNEENDYRPVYRQLRFGIQEKSDTNSNSLTLSPMEGEELLVILQVESRDEEPLPQKAASYGIAVVKQ